MNFRPMVTTDGKSWVGNALVFATKEEAEDSARELMGRWLAVRDTRADETDEPVNYVFRDGRNFPITFETDGPK